VERGVILKVTLGTSFSFRFAGKGETMAASPWRPWIEGGLRAL
jgi:hypothetical protein